MRFFATWGGLLAALIILQTVLGERLAVGFVKPDFFLIAVLFVAMGKGRSAATVWGVVTGFVQDILSGGIVGFNVLTKPATGYVVGLMRSRLDFDNPNTQTLVVFLATMAEGVLLSLMLFAYHSSKSVPTTFTRIVIPEAVYNALLFPFILPAWRLIKMIQESWRKRHMALAE